MKQMDQSNTAPSHGRGPISLQEALRSVGRDLDAAQVRQATLGVTTEGIDVEAGGDYGQRTYGWSDLEIQSRIQGQGRQPQSRPAPWLDPAALTRWSVLLRLVGQLLDDQAIHECLVRATIAPAETPRECEVAVTVDGTPIIDTEAVRSHLLRLRATDEAASPAEPSRTAQPYRPTDEAADQAEPPRAARPWWAFWRQG